MCDFVADDGGGEETMMLLILANHSFRDYCDKVDMRYWLTFDLWFARDNRLLNPKSSYKRIIIHFLGVFLVLTLTYRCSM